MTGSPIDAALADPWGTMELIAGGPLHPGGSEATEALLDRAGVGSGTVLLDAGCGAGAAVERARERGARAVGVDHDPDCAGGVVRGDVTALPVRTGTIDVVLAECVLCVTDLERSLAETRRALDRGGRLALSDVVVEGDIEVSGTVAEAFCLTGARSRGDLAAAVERAGFAVDGVEDHHEDLLAMRDRLEAGIDYRGLLGALGSRGEELLDSIDRLAAAVEDGRVGYVSLVATVE